MDGICRIKLMGPSREKGDTGGKPPKIRLGINLK